MNQDEERHIGVHHGARELENNVLLQSIPGLKDLYTTLDQFRSVAYNYNNPNYLNKEKDVKNGREKFNNNISILANRGMGKSSALLTIIREITNGRLFVKENYSENNIDIINPMIDLEDIQSDILGWVIASLSQRIDDMENMLKKNSKLLFSLEQSPNDLLKELKEKKNKLISCYSISGEEYNHVVLHRSVNINDYSRNLNDTLTNDYELHPAFEEFIDCLVDTKRQINRAFDNKPYEVDQEPLIYFFFDDLDMSSKKSIKILTDILSYFYHQNIVIFISGDYEVFENSIKTYFLNETKDITLKMPDEEKSNEITLAGNRAEYFLKKVLPPAYRYYIYEFFDNKQKAELHYFEVKNDVIESLNIFQLLSYIFYNGFHNQNVNSILKMFILPNISLREVERNDSKKFDDYDPRKNKFTDKSKKITIEEDYYDFKNPASLIDNNYKTNYLYAYLSVFSVNTRGFMNAYNYMCKEAYTIKKCRLNVRQYWTSDKLSEFIQIIINSKHTYLKYEKEINRFLSIKLGNYDDVDKEAEYTRLRIDCEELQIFIDRLLSDLKSKLNEYNDTSLEKEEIKSIIMLPILINELFYIIHGSLYQERYESVQNKLKNILTKTFINSLNDKIIVLPTELGMRRTLCLFQQISTRMSLESLIALNTTYDVNYSNPNNKKYIVQLYLSTLLLGNSGASINEENNNMLFNYNDYNLYKESMYQNEEERQRIENKISIYMNSIFRHLDREWLFDKIKMAISLERDISKVEQSVRNNFLQLASNTNIKNMYEKLDDLYIQICINRNRNEYYLLDGFKQPIWISNYLDDLFKTIEYQHESDIKVENYSFLQLNRIRDKLVKEFNTYEENTKRDLYLQIFNEIVTRLTNSKKAYEIGKVFKNNKKNEYNQQLIENSKRLVNLLDDFKIEFEILMSRLNSIYVEELDFDDILENQLFNYYDEEIYDLADETLETILNEHSFDIMIDCLGRNRSLLEEDLNSLIRHIYTELNRSTVFDHGACIEEIIKNLLRATRRQRRLVPHETKIIEVIIEENMNSYYIYNFILEACRVYLNKDTRFFHSFKTGIEYGNEE